MAYNDGMGASPYALRMEYHLNPLSLPFRRRRGRSFVSLAYGRGKHGPEPMVTGGGPAAVGNCISGEASCWGFCLVKYVLLLLLVGFAAPPANAKVVSYRPLRYTHVTGQADGHTCGAVAVSTLLTYYYGDPASEQEVLEVAFAETQASGKDPLEGLTAHLQTCRCWLTGQSLAADSC